MRMNEETMAYGAALLGAGVLLVLGYRKGTHVGDTVEVPATAVSGLPPGVPFDPTIHLAVKVSLVSKGLVSGAPVGLAANGAITQQVANPGFAVSFPVSAIVRKVA